MAIQLTSPDLSGLTGLSRGGNAALNLTVPGALGLQALQLANARSIAQQNNSTEQQKLFQQAQAAQAQQNIERQRLAQQGLLANQAGALEQQKLAQQGNQFQQTNQLAQQQLAQQGTLGQGNLDIEKQKVALQALQMDMASRVDQDKQALQQRGAFSSYAWLSLDKAQTPEEAQQIKNEILKEAVTKNYVTQDEAKALFQMPLSQTKNIIARDIMATGMAKDFKTLVDATKPANANGVTFKTNPDGTVEYSQTAAKTTVAQAQKDIMAANDNITELKNIYKNVPDDYFGAAAGKYAALVGREWVQNIPRIGSAVTPNEIDKKALEDYSNKQGAANMMAMSVIKQLSGVQYSDKQLEYLKEILPSFGPGTVRSVYEGRLKNLERYFDAVKKAREDVLRQGIDVGTPQYQQAMSQKIDSIHSSFNAPVSGLRQHLESMNLPKNVIDAELAKRGLQ